MFPKHAREKLTLTIVLVGSALFAWHDRFLQDDAYITFRYAANLLKGIGPVWNDGERVEGYTNALWMLLSAGALAVGLPVETFVYMAGMVLFPTTLWSTYRLVARLTSDHWLALGSVALLTAIYSFRAYATGGLETQLQTCCIVGLAWVAWRDEAGLSLRQSVVCGVLATAAITCRLDSVVLVTTILGARLLLEVRRGGLRLWRSLAPAVLVPTVVLAGWFAWKVSYYGRILPNTFYAKTGLGEHLERGLTFVWSFIVNYWFYLPPLGAVLAAVAAHRSNRRATFGALALAVLCWLGYVVKVGGDFMDYRFLVPILPLLAILSFWGASALPWPKIAAGTLLVSVAVGSERFRLNLGAPTEGTPQSILSLRSHLNGGRWIEIGQSLGRIFPAPLRPKIAVTPAGAMPYFSDLPSIDMLGLNDPEVADFLAFPGLFVGHQRLVTLNQLYLRGTNFIIAHPIIRAANSKPVTFDEYRHQWWCSFPDVERLRGAQIVEMPLNGNVTTFFLYLNRDRALSARLAELGWRTYPLL